MILSKSFSGAEGNSVMTDATNNQNIALLGYGYWGHNLARNLYELGVLSAVVEPNSDARAEVEKRFPGLKTFADTDAVWSDPTIEGVVLATPAVTHHALALEATSDLGGTIGAGGPQGP